MVYLDAYTHSHSTCNGQTIKDRAFTSGRGPGQRDRGGGQKRKTRDEMFSERITESLKKIQNWVRGRALFEDPEREEKELS